MRQYDKYCNHPDMSQIPLCHEKMLRSWNRMHKKRMNCWAMGCRSRTEGAGYKWWIRHDKLFKQEEALFLKIRELYPVWLS